MSSEAYNIIFSVLGVALHCFAVISALSFIVLVIRWRTNQRKKYLYCLITSIIAIPCIIGIHQAIVWLIIMPAMGKELIADIDATRAERFSKTTFVKVGDKVPEFSLTTIDGQTITFPHPENNKVIVINFFATWCGPCLMELPHIEQLWKELKDDKRFQLVVIGREETNESVETFRSENNFTFPIAADPEGKIFALFAERLIPRTIIISPNGSVVLSKMGFYESDIAELYTVIQEHLARLKK